ncbi:DUF1217 domain-containing protein [Gemmobacter serpentinus]|uniref:DUF1217 domain-containing protein n=1 Tax=Gemmobacter serpentinus TaxID=2652247 RepID=UPI00124F6A2C|nr:DUF1217 domain-containing protein [Gemmobacter serpentinus]
MTISLPLSGYAGWAFLKRTQERQMALVDANPVSQRDEAYFRAKIGSINSAEELVADRRLLTVALGAVGLSDDINNRFFIRKVLESDTLDSKSLANKLSDKRYAELAEAFSFGTFDIPRNKLSDFPDEMLSKYRARRFETVVGEANGTFRIALFAERELPDLAGSRSSDATKWFKIIGSEPLRTMFQTAFGLPSSFGSLNVDQQASALRSKAKAMFGSSEAAQFTDSAKLDKLMKQYLIRAEMAEGLSALSSRGSAALQILQAGGLSRRV